MSVEEALRFFAKIPKIRRRLQTLHDVGLDYIKLGQPATTLSGGEAQRVKLAAELCKVATGKTLYILDEPTTGLHFADIEKLLETLQRLVDGGNTMIVIEHNLDVIKQADWVIDLGPGGRRGGRRARSRSARPRTSRGEEVEGSFTRRASSATSLARARQRRVPRSTVGSPTAYGAKLRGMAATGDTARGSALERSWWLRAPAVLVAPRAVFVSLRDESEEAVEARQEPLDRDRGARGDRRRARRRHVARQLLNDSSISVSLIPVWAFLGGVGLRGRRLLARRRAALRRGAALRRSRQLSPGAGVLALSAAPLALALFTLWPIRIADLRPGPLPHRGQTTGAPATGSSVGSSTSRSPGAPCSSSSAFAACTAGAGGAASRPSPSPRRYRR